MGTTLGQRAQALRAGAALRVDVNELNPAAQGFYERLDFVVLGRSEVDGGGQPLPLLHMRRPAPESRAAAAPDPERARSGGVAPDEAARRS